MIASDASYHKDDRGYALARLVSMVPSNIESCEADPVSYVVRGQSSVLLTYNPKVGLTDLQHFALPDIAFADVAMPQEDLVLAHLKKWDDNMFCCIANPSHMSQYFEGFGGAREADVFEVQDEFVGSGG